MSRYGNDHHKADWVLLMKLLHWTGDDTSLVKSLFLSTPLGRRAKAQEPEGEGRRGNTNYVDRTIERILEKAQKPADETVIVSLQRPEKIILDRVEKMIYFSLEKVHLLPVQDRETNR